MRTGSSQRRWSRLIRGILPLLLIALAPAPGAAGADGRRRSDRGRPAAELVWPLPPDPPRIRYVDSLRGSSNFRKKPSRWRRFLLGPETDRGISLRKPYGVTTDAAGRVYVSDTGLGAVVVFDRDAREVRLLGHEGRVGLVTPIGLALDERGRLFVSDADLDRVFCFGGEGEVLLSLGREEGLHNPAGLAIDTVRHRLYVADSHLHRIFLYSTDGLYLTAWGSRGRAEGHFNFPTNLALDAGGNLHVVDTGNFRVQIFSPDGEFLSAFGEIGDGPGRFHRPKGIGLDSEGHIYVADAAFNNFQIFNQGGELLLFVGTLGSGPGNFWLPAGIHVDRSDRIYVVDQINARVQIFQYLPEAGALPAGSDATGAGEPRQVPPGPQRSAAARRP
ncbi:MAG: 6-bladed beta-propeller [Acidobacteriota bacterium]